MNKIINIKLKRIFTFLSILILLFSKSYSQEISFADPYSEKLLFSPAYSAIGECSEINFAYNKAFLYNYYSSSYNNYFKKYNSGLGIVIANDNQANNAINNININFIYTYKIFLNKRSIINTAFQIGYTQQSINSENLIFSNQINPFNSNIAKNTNEYNFRNYKNINFTGASTYLSKKYRFGIVLKNINNLFTNNKTNFNPLLKLHFAKTFHFNKTIFYSTKNSISPEIIYKTQNGFNYISYGVHFNNKNILIRYFLSNNINFNTFFSAITFGIKIKKTRISYTYKLAISKQYTLPNSSNQISIFIKIPCRKKRNSTKTIFCIKK